MVIDCRERQSMTGDREVRSEQAVAEPLPARRRRLIRADIERVAMRMFLDRGYDAVSVDDVAEAVGMSSRTFFRYYATKDEVLRSYQRGLTDALVDAFAAQPDDTSAVAALRAAYVATSHVAQADRERVRALGRLLATAPAVHARSVGESLLDDRIETEFARRSRARRNDPRPAVIVAAVAAAATVAWNRWVTRDDARDPAVVVAAAINVLGLGD
jgi:AcrR family transcriptional regulator